MTAGALVRHRPSAPKARPRPHDDIVPFSTPMHEAAKLYQRQRVRWPRGCLNRSTVAWTRKSDALQPGGYGKSSKLVDAPGRAGCKTKRPRPVRCIGDHHRHLMVAVGFHAEAYIRAQA